MQRKERSRSASTPASFLSSSRPRPTATSRRRTTVDIRSCSSGWSGSSAVSSASGSRTRGSSARRSGSSTRSWPRSNRVADWDTVRELALSFPEVEASSSGRVAFSVRGKGFAWEARERDGGGLAVRVDREEKQLILDADPEVYFTSLHYTGFPAVQIRVEAIDRDELRDRLEDAWLIQAPRKVADAYVAEDESG